jgi:hypothetical protein
VKPKIYPKNFYDTMLRNDGVGLVTYKDKNPATIGEQVDFLLEEEPIRKYDLIKDQLANTQTLNEINDARKENTPYYDRFKSNVKPQLMLHREEPTQDLPAIIGLDELTQDFHYDGDAELALLGEAKKTLDEVNPTFSQVLSGAVSLSGSGNAMPYEVGFFVRGMPHPTTDTDYPVERFLSDRGNPIEYRLAPDRPIRKIYTKYVKSYALQEDEEPQINTLQDRYFRRETIPEFDPESDDAIENGYPQFEDFLSGIDTPRIEIYSEDVVTYPNLIPEEERDDDFLQTTDLENFFVAERYYPFHNNDYTYAIYIGKSKYSYDYGGWSLVNQQAINNFNGENNPQVDPKQDHSIRHMVVDVTEPILNDQDEIVGFEDRVTKFNSYSISHTKQEVRNNEFIIIDPQEHFDYQRTTTKKYDSWVGGLNVLDSHETETYSYHRAGETIYVPTQEELSAQLEAIPETEPQAFDISYEKYKIKTDFTNFQIVNTNLNAFDFVETRGIGKLTLTDNLSPITSFHPPDVELELDNNSNWFLQGTFKYTMFYEPQDGGFKSILARDETIRLTAPLQGNPAQANYSYNQEFLDEKFEFDFTPLIGLLMDPKFFDVSESYLTYDEIIKTTDKRVIANKLKDVYDGTITIYFYPNIRNFYLESADHRKQKERIVEKTLRFEQQLAPEITREIRVEVPAYTTDWREYSDIERGVEDPPENNNENEEVDEVYQIVPRELIVGDSNNFTADYSDIEEDLLQQRRESIVRWNQSWNPDYEPPEDWNIN